MSDTLNREHWNTLNRRYTEVWQKPAKKRLSSKELGFIQKYLIDKAPKTILDIGVGNGRILANHLKYTSSKSEIYGVDIASEMINVCHERFDGVKNVKDLQVCNISKENIPFNKKFDLITSIRVLKYNKNWPGILKKVYKQLNPQGVCIFTMPNSKSVSAIYKDKYSVHNLSIYYTNTRELESILKKIGFKVLEIRGFSKLPNFLYDLGRSSGYVNGLLGSEAILEKVFGEKLLGRELFIACEKL